MPHHRDADPPEGGIGERIAAQLATPAIARFLGLFPDLRTAVTEALTCAERVRRAKLCALTPGGLPLPDHGSAFAHADSELRAAAEEVVLLAAPPGGPPTRASATAALRRLTGALLALRVEGQAFSRPRSISDAAARRELFAALTAFDEAYRRLEARGAERRVVRLPWQIELATHFDPETPVAELEITGCELPLVPAARRPWGERCVLSGHPFHTDSRRVPQARFRSLDAWHHVLAPEYHDIVARLGPAIEALRQSAPDAVRDLARLCPFLFEDYVREAGNPTFLRLGLLDYPALAVALNNLLLTYRDRPFLGRRGEDGGFAALGLADRAARALAGPAARTGYVWQTYAEARGTALELAWALERLGLRSGDRLGIVTTENAPEFPLADFAAVFSQLVSIGLDASLGAEPLAGLAARTGLKAIVADAAAARCLAATELARTCPELATLVVFGAEPDGLPVAPGLQVCALAQLLARATPPDGWRAASGVGPLTPVIFDDRAGHESARESGIVPDPDDAVYAVVFSSGTTGEPKGTVVTRRRWAEEMFLDANVWPHVAASFLPSSLMADRASVWRALHNGGRVGFARRGAALFHDLRAVRPTLLDAPPAIWSAVLAPLKTLHAAGAGRGERAAARAAARAQLGGRLAWVAVGGAPSEPELRLGLSELLGIPVAEGYGTTETGQIAADGRLRPGLDVRLLDVPELGLFAADVPPRGELAVRTLRSSTSYFADDPRSPEHFTEDGYFLTGDLVELGRDGTCRVIGRRRHAFKLAGAEFITPEELERRFLASELVEAVFVTGLPSERAVVAVVVPTRAEVGEPEVLASLRRIARRERLRPCEVPAGVIIDPKDGGVFPWTVENGLLTPSLKPSRRALDARYGERVAAVYARARQGGAADLSVPAVLDRESATRLVLAHAAAALSRDIHDLDPSRSFADLGGDSVSALDFVLRLEGLGLVGEADTDASSLALRSLADVARELAAHAAGGPARPAPAEAILQSAGATPSSPPTRQGDAVVLDVEAIAAQDAQDLPRPGHLPPRAVTPDVVLTGATGFLGVHLVGELAALQPEGARVFAIVRAGSDAEARERLRASLAGAALPVPPIALPGEATGARVVAVAGDVGATNLGLREETWQRLAGETGMVVHAAAEVRPGPDYQGLRAANVTATRRLLELATTGVLKAFHLVSSLNVALLIEDLQGRQALEDSPLPERLPTGVSGRHPAYAITKWASERLVEGLRVEVGGAFRASVSRPALLTWSSRTGFANQGDWLTRVLRSCLELRAVIGDPEAGVPCFAPVSESSARGLDLVPVDFAARAIAYLAVRTWAGSLPASGPPLPQLSAATFHVSNTNPGGAGLVTRARLMDLLAAADLPFARPGDALRFLPLADWALAVERAGAPALPVLGVLANPALLRPRTPAAFLSRALHGDGEEAVRCPAVGHAYLTSFVRRYYEQEAERP